MVSPLNELPHGVPAVASVPEPAKRVTSRGKFGAVLAGSAEASELARRAAKARWEKARQIRVLEGLGLKRAAPEALAPYLEDAEQFAKYETERLARTVGGGVCEGAAATMVQSAALQLAASRAAFATGEVQLGSRLADASRQNLLAALEVTAREAQARPKTPAGVPWLVEGDSKRGQP